MSRALMVQTNLDERVLPALVHDFYEKVRADFVPRPIFATRIQDWDTHLARMVAFWSSGTLMTGRYHGTPMPELATLPIDWSHFERRLALFCETAIEVYSPTRAESFIDRAKRRPFPERRCRGQCRPDSRSCPLTEEGPES